MSNEQKRGFFDGDGRMLYVFGLVTGIAIMALFGNGINLPSLNAANNGGSGTVRTFDSGSNGGSAAAAMPDITEDDHVRGGDIKKAKVVLVEYSDFECPFCSRHHPTLQQVLDEYGNDVAWVYRHFPLSSIHPEALPAAVASECAGEQGKFWEYGDELFERQATLGDATYTAIAKDLGLNMSKFESCLTSGDYNNKIAAQQQGGADAGVTGTPGTFINGQLVSGAVPYEQLKSIIDSILAE